MEELAELKRRLAQERPVEWDALPDIKLYMDQVIAYMPRQLIRFGEGETLTSAMVNNYSKDGMLPKAEGKRYSRTHLAYLTAICALKQVLSVKDANRLIAAGVGNWDNKVLYDYFLRALDKALTETAADLDENVSEDALPQLALNLALRSYADKLACERVLDILEQQRPHLEKQDKPRKKG